MTNCLIVSIKAKFHFYSLLLEFTNDFKINKLKTIRVETGSSFDLGRIVNVIDLKRLIFIRKKYLSF